MQLSERTQIGHSLELHFNPKFEFDSIEYEDENIKALGYKVVAGANKLQTTAQEFVKSRNRKAKIRAMSHFFLTKN